MNNIKRDHSLKAWVQSTGGHRGLGRAQNSTFSEYGNVAYLMKGFEIYNNILANIFLSYTPSTSGVGSKGQNSCVCLFLKIVMLHIK